MPSHILFNLLETEANYNQYCDMYDAMQLWGKSRGKFLKFLNGGIGICKSPGAMSCNILYIYRGILLNLNLRDQMRLGNANGRELIVHNMNVVHKI